MCYTCIAACECGINGQGADGTEWEDLYPARLARVPFIFQLPAASFRRSAMILIPSQPAARVSGKRRGMHGGGTRAFTRSSEGNASGATHSPSPLVGEGFAPYDPRLDRGELGAKGEGDGVHSNSPAVIAGGRGGGGVVIWGSSLVRIPLPCG